jgi:transaldolase
LKDNYRVAFGNDPDADRHGIVTPSAGLMNPNHYLAVAIRYLLTHRSLWPEHAAVGKTLVSSSMIDKVVQSLGRRFLAAAEAFMRGVERRMEAGLPPGVDSVASIFVSRWDVAVTGKVPDSLRDRLGIAIAKRTYKAYRTLLDSPRWQRAFSAGAGPQRLLWASTGTKDPKASDVIYIKALAAPFTVNTMPEGTLKALADHGEVGTILPPDGGDCEEVLAQFAKAGIDVDALAAQLQDEGAKSFDKSWNELMAVITAKSAALQTAVAN